MITLIIAARRRAAMTNAEFRRYVKDVHAPLVLQDPDAATLIRAYTQNHVFDAAYGAAPGQPYPAVSERDIVTEVCFDGVEQMGRARHTPMYLDVIQPDEDNFADQATVLALPTRGEELAVPRPRPAPIKAIHYLRHAAGISGEAFAQHWHDAHAAIVAQNPEIGDSLAKYVQNHALASPRGGVDERARYGVAMLWFDSCEALSAFHAYHGQLATIAAQHGDFFDPAQSFFMFAEEFVLKA